MKEKKHEKGEERPKGESWNFGDVMCIKQSTSKDIEGRSIGRPFCCQKAGACADDRTTSLCYALSGRKSVLQANDGNNLTSILVAFVGAVILLWLLRLVSGHRS